MAGTARKSRKTSAAQMCEGDVPSTAKLDVYDLLQYDTVGRESTMPYVRYYFTPLDKLTTVRGTSSYAALWESLDSFKRDTTERLELVEDRVDALERRLSSQPVLPRTDVRRPPREEIKDMIREHVESHGSFWPDEFALDNNLSVWEVLDAIDELAAEGYLEERREDDVPRRKR